MAGWRESGFQLLLALIASTLLGSVVAAAASEYSKPIIRTSMIAVHPFEGQSTYEILVNNVGRGAAENVRLSMFFPANITSYFPIVYSDNMTLTLERKNVVVHSVPIRSDFSIPVEYEPSILVADIPRLSSGGKAIIGVSTDSSDYSPLYISAAFGQESAEYYIPSLSDEIEFKFPQTLNERPFTVPLTSQLLIIMSVVAFVLFGIAIKQTRDKRSQQNQMHKIENEIRDVKQKLQDSPGSQEKFSSKIWHSKSLADRHQFVKGKEDYQTLDVFFDAIAKRNSNENKMMLPTYNKECYRLAVNALGGIEWSKYYGEKRVDDNTINVLLALLIAVPIAVFLLFLIEELPLRLLEPAVFVSPPDVTQRVPFGVELTDFNGRSWVIGGLFDVAIIFSMFAYMVRGLSAFLIARYILLRAFRTKQSRQDLSPVDNPLEEGKLFEAFEVNRKQQTKLLGYSFLIMGFPIWSILNLFFSTTAYVIFNFEGSSLFLTVVLVEVIRFSALMVLVPILLQRGKIKETSDVSVPRQKALIYLGSALIFLSGSFHLVFAGILLDIDIGGFSLVSIIAIVLGLIQTGWAIGFRRKRSRIMYFVGIAGATAIIALWIFTLVTFLVYSDEFERFTRSAAESRSLDPITLVWTILLGMVGILIFLALYVGISFKILKEIHAFPKEGIRVMK